MSVRVMIVEDHDDFREGLSHILRSTDGFRCVGAFASMEEAMKTLPQADVVLMDIGLPGKSGIDGVRMIRKRSTDIQIVMLTVYDDDRHIFEAITAGANGYILKRTAPLKILEAIQEAAKGGMPMTPFVARQVVEMFRRYAPTPEQQIDLTKRERDVLSMLPEGMNYAMVGEKLFISLDTVRNHIRHIYEKLHVHSKSEAVAKAIRQGLV